MTQLHTGSCLCGAVGVTVAGELRHVGACHCGQCRKQSGHYWVSVDIPRDRLKIRGEHNLCWYQSSQQARRGFCKICGSFLFWEASARASIEVAMGAFAGPTGAKITSHIFVGDQGDYYDITDGLPQFGATPDEIIK